MKVLIKIGGTLLDNPSNLAGIAQQLASVANQCNLAVVHGGGKQVTQFLDERGISSEFINGLRISDEAVIDAVIKVIAGTVNKRLVGALIGAGCDAVGLSGLDGKMVIAGRVDDRLKFTGKPSSSDGRLLDLLVRESYLPVIACIAGDKEGQVLNVNADQLAVSCATGWHADKLFFLTDVPGVKDKQGQIISHILAHEVPALIQNGVATGGMQAKLEACVWALQGGIREAVIAPGADAHICDDLLAGKAVGTSLSFSTIRASATDAI